MGCAVVVLDQRGIAGMVTSDRLPEWRRWNLGRRLLTGTHDVGRLVGQLERYDPRDAARCTDLVRAECGLDTMVESLVALYTESLDEWRAGCASDARAELISAAALLATIGPLRRDVLERDNQLAHARSEVESAAARAGSAEAETSALRVRSIAMESDVARLESEAAAAHAALERDRRRPDDALAQRRGSVSPRPPAGGGAGTPEARPPA